MKQKLFAEFWGTFALLFAGTGAVVINEVSGAVTHVGIAITFGLIIMAMIYTLGDISGAHFNPAVTMAFAFAKRFAWREVGPYIGAQCGGALLGSGVLKLLFPGSKTLGATLPAGSNFQSFALEFLLTALLMFVILNVSTGAKEKGITAGLVVGSIIGLEAMFAGPICGASMNPARSFSPALLSGHISALWIYIFAPISGALAGVLAFDTVRQEGRPNDTIVAQRSLQLDTL